MEVIKKKKGKYLILSNLFSFINLAVMGCASLMKKALELQPDSVTYALSYLHSQEILVQYQTGFTSAK